MMDIVTRAEAVALGLPRYFTGVPCRNGHLCEKLTPKGVCLQCRKAAKAAYHARKMKGDSAYAAKARSVIAASVAKRFRDDIEYRYERASAQRARRAKRSGRDDGLNGMTEAEIDAMLAESE